MFNILILIPLLFCSFFANAKQPLIDFNSSVQVVTELDFPPGNIAISAEGRIFLTLHPDAKPPFSVGELLPSGELVPFPDQNSQADFTSTLSIRVDKQNRLWVLNPGNHGLHRPQLFAYDLSTNQRLNAMTYLFERRDSGLGSMFNDFQISPDGRFIFIANSAVVGQMVSVGQYRLNSPSIVVFDTQTKQVSEHLIGHPTVLSSDREVIIDGQKVRLMGLLPIPIGIDSIALDSTGKFLYFAPLTAGKLFRVATEQLTHLSGISDIHVEHFADISLSDGIITDHEGNIYITDMEASAIRRVDRDGNMSLLIQDKSMRWPDGFSFAPDGFLYFTCSALQIVFPSTFWNLKKRIKENAPYQVFRFRPSSS